DGVRDRARRLSLLRRDGGTALEAERLRRLLGAVVLRRPASPGRLAATVARTVARESALRIRRDAEHRRDELGRDRLDRIAERPRGARDRAGRGGAGRRADRSPAPP